MPRHVEHAKAQLCGKTNVIYSQFIHCVRNAHYHLFKCYSLMIYACALWDVTHS